MVTGISIGGSLPVIYSVLGDLFPAKQRPAIAAVVTTGTGLGMGIGQIIAGSVDSWRLPFLVVAIPGFICSGCLLFVEDPKRGANEAAVLEMRRHRVSEPSSLSESDRRTMTTSIYGNNLDSKKALENCGMDSQISAVSGSSIKPNSPYNDSFHNITPIAMESEPVRQKTDDEIPVSKRTCVSCKSTWQLMKIPSVVLTILQAAPGALPFGFCATFLNDFLQEQRGMEKQVSIIPAVPSSSISLECSGISSCSEPGSKEATGVLVTFGAGNAIGVIIGGFLGHFTYKRDVRGPPFVMGISLILGCIPFYFLINHIDENASVSCIP